MGASAIIGIVGAVASIGLLGSDGAAVQEGLGEHLLVTNDGGPRRIAAKARQIVVAGLRIEIGDTTLGLLAVKLLLANSTGAASVLGRLLGRRSTVGLGGRLRIG